MIEGEKVNLRPLTAADTDLIVGWRNQPFVREKMIRRALITAESHREWVRTMVETGKAVQFVIIEKQSNRPVGSVFLRDIDYDFAKAEFGIFIGEEEARGQGYGTEAAALLLAYAFAELRLHKVFLRLLAGNEAAEKSYAKAGFRREAVLKDDVKPEGEFCDVIIMSAFNHAV
ncbi:MAG: GNAT family N-acetyltransferase [Lachnospiraceae bacterium]|jgi:UDP-4-amino-4,6-dideoxy-N-acetyl-beta-L-altrosamine N-acetyltransferase|nr:GNAT family N-acetyltransferase [Lachnospiraceae bacterium]